MLSFAMLAQMRLCSACNLLGLFLNTLCEFLKSEENLEESEVFNQLQQNSVWIAWIILWKVVVVNIRNF